MRAGIRRPKETAITRVVWAGVDQMREESISWTGRFKAWATGLMGTVVLWLAGMGGRGGMGMGMGRRTLAKVLKSSSCALVRAADDVDGADQAGIGAHLVLESS